MDRAVAPVNEWDVMPKGFASAHDCEQFRAQGKIMENLNVPTDVAPMVFAQRRAASRCVPDDDPRLQGPREER
jgi:hypothetical protein